MNTFFTRLGLSAALCLAGAAAQAQAPTIDGTRDASYPSALAVQTVQTGFGDATTGSPTAANGSELDNIHARIVGTNLYLFIGGNLESNYNKLDIFFDSKTGGQNQLVGNTNYLTTMNGIKFDAGFTADYALSLACGTGALKLYADYAPIPTGSTITATGIGSSNTNFSASLNFSTVVAGAGTGSVSIDDSNTAGVTGGTAAANTAAATAVSTGIEYMIPLTALGTTAGGGDIKIMAFINGGGHDYISNQILAGAPAGTATFAVAVVDFTTVAGNQFVTVANSTTTATRNAQAAAPLAAYPNPSATGFTLGYEAARPGTYALHIFSTTGQLVATRTTISSVAGSSLVEWNGCDNHGQVLAAGVYVAELNGQHQRLTLLR